MWWVFALAGLLLVRYGWYAAFKRIIDKDQAESDRREGS